MTALALFGAIALVLSGVSSAAGPRTGKPGWVAVKAAGPVVKQVGKRNYAGPDCPGRGWNCTTATRVLQVATDGGENVATCTTQPVLTPSSQSCQITQEGSSNVAWCGQRMTTVPATNQTCVIKQTGALNQAAIGQSVEQKRGATQAANQFASVTQGPRAEDADAKNVLGLVQVVTQTTGTGAIAASQAQDGHQWALVSQTARGAGTNWSDVYQSQAQTAGNAQSQLQNAGGLPSGFVDCAEGGAATPNACANIAQHSIGGNNTSILRQTVTESETSRVASTQVQGSDDGGLQGKVHQDTVSGSSTNKASQNKQQTMTAAAGSTQTQHDPISCCGFASQDGGTGNTETISQTSSQNASEPNAVQTSEISGESVSDGTCSVTQSATVNGDSTSISESQEPPCGALVVESSCEGSECNSTVVPQEEVLGASLPTAGIDGTITQGGAPNYADTYVTPYVSQFGGSVTSWTAQFTGGVIPTGEISFAGVPAGIQLKVLRPVANTSELEVVAAGAVHDPRPVLQDRFGTSYPFFQTQDAAITFTDRSLEVQPGDILGMTISSDPNAGAYFYPLVGPAGTRIVLRDVPVGGTIDLKDPFTGTVPNTPALQVTLGEAAPPPPID